MMNSTRMLVSILRDVCAARGIEVTSFSDDWIFLLRKGDATTHVIGYDFALNSATAKMLCKDKSATSDLLAHAGVPRVEHRLFHGPQLKGYVPPQGNWREMLGYFEACGGDVVCKPNEGTGGRNVFRARTEAELEAAVLAVFERSRSLCLSPFETIEEEFRVAVLEGEVQFVYHKERPFVVADGTRSVRAMMLERLAAAPTFGPEVEAIGQMAEDGLDFDAVPPAGERVLLNWRHNLGQGARAVRHDPNGTLARPICALALSAAKTLGVAVASVDVVQTSAGLKILEINSGIMMESLVRSGDFGPELARRFYERIVCRSLGLA